jgi:hypothetical protein
MFTLAEDEAKAKELTQQAFDMYYGWELHHLMNSVAQGKSNVNDLWNYFAKVDSTLCPKAIRMNFTSNHDENSWNGTEFERMGNATDLFAAFTYIVPGMPMIYTGQMSGNHHRLEFFEKDVIDRVENAPQHALYKSLNAFRKANKAIWSNEIGAEMKRLACDNENIFACVRQKVCPKGGENTVVALMNMSGEEQTLTIDMTDYVGSYHCICDKTVEITPSYTITLAPWSYQLLAK